MKAQIQTALKPLIGLDLSRLTRAANMECFHFGILTVVDDKQAYGEFALHIQCPWRITNRKEIVVGYEDLYEPINENAEYDPDFDWDISGGNLRDVKLDDLLKREKLTVDSVNVDEFGGFILHFTNNIDLTIFPTLTRKFEYGEYWRLLYNRTDESHHFVVGTFGIE